MGVHTEIAVVLALVDHGNHVVANAVSKLVARRNHIFARKNDLQTQFLQLDSTVHLEHLE